MEELKEFFSKNDLLAKHLGIELVDVRAGYAKATMEVKSFHLNFVKMANGGAIFTLSEYFFSVACNSHGNVSVAINVSISYMKAVLEGTILTAEGRELSLNPKLGTYTIDVTDDDGDLVAVFQGMAYRKKDRILDQGKKAEVSENDC